MTMPTNAALLSLALREKTAVYSCAMTYAEYAALSSRLEFLEIRAREIRLLPEVQLFFTTFPEPVHWLAVVDEGPDTWITLPLLAHIGAWIPRASLRIVRDEDAMQLLAALVEDAELLAQWADADLPLLLTFDEEWHFQAQWGPHPQAMEDYWAGWLAEHSNFDQLADDVSFAGQQAYARLQETRLHEMRMWYNSALNQAVAEELRSQLARWRDENGDEMLDEDDNGGDDLD